MIRRATLLKRLFEVTVRRDGEAWADAKTLLVVADDEQDALSVDDLTSGEEVVRVVEVHGTVRTVGPSRVIGFTRAAA